MRNKLVTLLFICTALACICYSCQSEADIEYARYYGSGKQLYEKHCQNCHGGAGAGLGDLIPPLTDSTFLKGNKKKLSCIIKNGLSGKVIVAGKTYEGQMPAETHLANIEIAEIITYISNSFGNKQGIYTAASTDSDLKNCE